MDLALYDPELGYYARAAQRSGRAGDFFTSVDVGPLFGELLAMQIAEMAAILESRISAIRPFDLVEAAPATAGSRPTSCARCARRASRPATSACGCHLVEASPAARAAQARDARADRRSAVSLRPRRSRTSFEGVAPRQRAARRDAGAPGRHARRRPARGVRRMQRTSQGGPLGPPPTAIREGPLSTPALAEYLDRLGVDARAGLARRRSTCARSTGFATPRGGCGAASSS